MKFFRNIVLVVLFIVLLCTAYWTFHRNRKNVNNPAVTYPQVVSDNSRSSFTFAVISDIHSDLSGLNRSLTRIQQDRVDFIIVTGDLTGGGKREELKTVKTILDNSRIPYYAIPGNHDLWLVKGKTNPFKEIFGADYQSFAIDNIKFILVNNGSYTGIDKTQIDWFSEELEGCRRIYCLVFAHMPLNHPFLSHIMGENSKVAADQANKLIQDLVNNNIRELYAGHIHFLSSYTMDGLTTNTSGAIYTDNNSPEPRFLEVNVSVPSISFEKKEIWLNDTSVE